MKKIKGKRMVRSVIWVLALLIGFCANSILPKAAGEGTTYADQACSGVVRVFSSFDGMASTGSGFGVGAVGEETDIFITNWHVVSEEKTGKISDEVYILLDNEAVKVDQSGAYVPDYSRMVKCEVLRTTEGYPDYAILRAERKIEGHIALPLLPSREAKRGENVFALGFPGSSDMANGKTYCAAQIEDVTVTTGTLSRFTELKIAGNTMVIQHDAHINHGNSGGPLITEDGAVIGINTYYFGVGEEETEVENEHSAAVFIDYAIEALEDLGIYYEVWSGSNGSEEPGQESGGAGVPVGAAAVCAGLAAAVCAAMVIIRKRKNTSSSQPSQPGSVSSISVPPQPGSSVSGPGSTQPGSRVPVLAKAPASQSQPDSGIRLQAVSGIFAGKRYAINNRVRIGRDASRNELVYPQDTPGISGVHCEVGFQGGQVYIRDVGSSYGTYVGGKRIAPNQQVPIKIGESFYLGQPAESFVIARKK